jgi:hypothetical protein
MSLLNLPNVARLFYGSTEIDKFFDGPDLIWQKASEGGLIELGLSKTIRSEFTDLALVPSGTSSGDTVLVLAARRNFNSQNWQSPVTQIFNQNNRIRIGEAVFDGIVSGYEWPNFGNVNAHEVSHSIGLSGVGNISVQGTGGGNASSAVFPAINVPVADSLVYHFIITANTLDGHTDLSGMTKVSEDEYSLFYKTGPVSSNQSAKSVGLTGMSGNWWAVSIVVEPET